MQDVSHESKAVISKRLDFKVCTELTILHAIKSDATWDRMLTCVKHGFIGLSQNPKSMGSKHTSSPVKKS